jgi:hypothetical protein
MNAPINTNVRLFDLVRYMRSELHEAELITDDEYFWLCAEAPMAKGQGSPSPRRLEDYDEIKAKMKLRRGTSKEARAIWKMVEEAAAQSPPWMRGHIKKIVAARFPTSQNTKPMEG